MSATRAAQAATCVAHILERFHETHRRELPPLVAQARALQALGGDVGLTTELQALADALERHMFKEEMRLFPMMEQGGNTLIGHLIDDLETEHAEHAARLAPLRQHLAALQAPPGGESLLEALRRGFDKLAADLEAHILVEDGTLFALFAERPAGAA